MVDTYHPHMRYTSSEFQIDPVRLAKILPSDYDANQPSVVYSASQSDDNVHRYLLCLRNETDRLVILNGGPGYNDKISSVQDLREYARNLPPVSVPRWFDDLMEYLEEECSETVTHTDSITCA
jgi:hypothetical protein